MQIECSAFFLSILFQCSLFKVMFSPLVAGDGEKAKWKFRYYNMDSEWVKNRGSQWLNDIFQYFIKDCFHRELILHENHIWKEFICNINYKWMEHMFYSFIALSLFSMWQFDFMVSYCCYVQAIRKLRKKTIK